MTKGARKELLRCYIKYCGAYIKTSTRLKEAENPDVYSLRASPFFKVALCASLPQAKARGAICVSVLASKLSDTLSLDYQSSSHPTQYPTKFLDIALDISPRLATLDSQAKRGCKLACERVSADCSAVVRILRTGCVAPNDNVCTA